MESSSAVPVSHSEREDILALLPVSTIVEYRKGKIIYGPDQPSTSIYVLAAGTVRLSHIADDGYEAVVELIRPDEMFGESAFLNLARSSERATAHENTEVMVWPVSTIEDLITKRPRLAVSLLQISAQRNVDFAQRIESLVIDNIERRLARTLIRLSKRLGAAAEDGSIRMIPMTHQLLSQHIGTSRELVTSHMNRFRKKGFLDYTRQQIVLYPSAFANWTNTASTPS
jgi:CRP/FNR family transcriptional regulator, cyclic AMP receptor protein